MLYGLTLIHWPLAGLNQATSKLRRPMDHRILDTDKIAILGLGYVGLPLAVEFGKSRPVVGFDIKHDRIEKLRAGIDDTLEVEADELAEAKHLSFTNDIDALRDCRIFIVTVPTPIDSANRPDLSAILGASELVGKVCKSGDYVIYESTVYPGATEEDCVPVIERTSGLKLNQDFFAGYSPERINPGDKTHRLPSICKVTSGSTPEAAAEVDKLYASIITAGTHLAPTIRVAEAAKVIENTQRDLNIALINELAVIFNRMSIDTQAVLEAAGTKWNFQGFRPGLVGGHCIGVDPYYLTHKAESIGYRPEIILAGRRLNDGMAAYVAGELVKAMVKKDMAVKGSRTLVLGVTFKENCPDLRNTKVVDMVAELKSLGVLVDVHDPCADPAEAMAEYNLPLIATPEPAAYDAVIIAVAHDQFKQMGIDAIRTLGKDDYIIYDLKFMYPATETDMRL